VKLLTRDSQCLKGLPTVAVDRFLELVASYDVPKGMEPLISDAVASCMMYTRIHSICTVNSFRLDI
jgi:hypothetical protein